MACDPRAKEARSRLEGARSDARSFARSCSPVRTKQRAVRTDQRAKVARNACSSAKLAFTIGPGSGAHSVASQMTTIPLVTYHTSEVILHRNTSVYQVAIWLDDDIFTSKQADLLAETVKGLNEEGVKVWLRYVVLDSFVCERMWE